MSELTPKGMPDRDTQAKKTAKNGSETIAQTQLYVDTHGIDAIPFKIPDNYTPISILEALLSTAIQREAHISDIVSATIPQKEMSKKETEGTQDEAVKRTIQDALNQAQDIESSKSEQIDFDETPSTPAPSFERPIAPPLQEPAQLRSHRTSRKPRTPEEPRKADNNPKPPRVNLAKATRLEQPKPEPIPPDSLVFDADNGSVMFGRKTSPAALPHQAALLRALSSAEGRSITATDILGEDASDPGLLHLLELAIRKLSTDLERDPNMPVIFTFNGTGASLRISCKKNIFIKQSAKV